MQINLPTLHAAQREILAVASNRRVLIRAGRRFGKTTYLNYLIAKFALEGRRVGVFVPNYKLGLPIFYEVRRTLFPVTENSSKIEQAIFLVNGGAVELWTLTDPDAGRSRYYDLAVIDEASIVPGLTDIWEQAIAPTLLDRTGLAVMAGTPKGRDGYFYLASSGQSSDRWVEFHAPTSRNPLMPAIELERIRQEYPPLVWRQEYMAEFVDWAGESFFSVRYLLRENGQPYEELPRPDMIFITIDTAAKDGSEHDASAAILWSYEMNGSPNLMILDYDVTRIDANLLTDWVPRLIQGGQRAASEMGARRGFQCAWVEDRSSGIALIQSSKREGLPVEPIDGKLTQLGKDGRAIAVSRHVASRRVGIHRWAYDKVKHFGGASRNHLLDQISEYHLGERNRHKMDLVDCFTYGVSISLGSREGF